MTKTHVICTTTSYKRVFTVLHILNINSPQTDQEFHYFEIMYLPIRI